MKNNIATSICTDASSCLIIKIFTKILQNGIEDGEGVCIHLEGKKFIISFLNKNILIESGDQYDYKDMQRLDVLCKNKEDLN